MLQWVRSSLLLAASLVATPAAAAGTVAIIGVDAFTFEVADPLMARGEMPHLESLIRRGVRGELTSEKPMRSPALWTTMATGQPRHVHGIFDFVTGSRYWPDGQRGREQRLVTSDMRRSKALWQLADEQGRSSLVVGWLNSWPAEKVRGLMVAPYVALGHKKQTSIKGKIYKDARGQTYPPSAFKRVKPLIRTAESMTAAEVAQIADVPKPNSPLLRRIPKLRRYLYTVRWSLAGALTNVAILEQELKHNQHDLVMTFFDGADTLGHRFWLFRQPMSEIRQRLKAHGFNPDDAGELKQRFGAAVDNYYRFFDRQLGRILRALPPDATVMLVSDHGFGTYPKARAIHSTTPFDGTHLLNGMLVAAGPSVRRGARLPAHLQVDVMPTALHAMELPVPRDLPGSVASTMFKPQYLAAHPLVRTVGTLPADASATPATQGTTYFEDEELERLRSLGYVE